jgi:type III secretion system low calcium response chaperone LcrH/SycD
MTLPTTTDNHTQQQVNALMDGLAQGLSLGEITGMNPEMIEGLYAFGHSLYSSNNYRDAETVFRTLCLYKHNEYRFWLGLAATLQGLEHYDKAAEAYGMAGYQSQLTNPEPFWFAAQCFLKLGKKEEAVGTLTAMATMGDDKPEYAATHEKAKNLLALLQAQ